MKTSKDSNQKTEKLAFGERVTKRLKKTRLKMFQAGEWAAGNASVFFEAGAKTLNAAGGSLSARNAAVDIAHAAEDCICSD
jgi:hypothetical protein